MAETRLNPELTLPAVGEDGREVSGTPADHTACLNADLPEWHRRTGEFWDKVLRTDCCWLWIGGRNGQYGYGKAWFQGHLESAHRVAWQLANGQVLPRGHARIILHRCDVPHCVRPDHLWLGTASENTADMDAKGRRTWRTPKAKLTAGQVKAIRRLYALGESQANLARWFDLSPVGIWKIVHGETWRDDVQAMRPAQRRAVLRVVRP